MKYKKYGSTAVVVSALLWSVDGLLRRHLYSLPAPVIVFWEHALGFLVLLPMVALSWRDFRKLTRKQWLSIIGVSFLSGAVGTIMYTAALGRVLYIPFSVVVLLQQLNPIFAIATSAVLLREPLTKRFYALSTVALIAGYFVTFPNARVVFGTGRGTLIAALLAVGAAAAWGSSTAFSKYALKDTSSLHITTLRFGITSLFAVPFIIGSHCLSAWGAMTAGQLKYLVAITFSTGLVALVIYYYGLQRVLASRSAILELAWPVSAVVVGFVWLHQGLTISQAVAAVILAGVIVMIVRDSQAKVPAI
jgi:DME family drug/metabolite transporter